MSPFAFHAIQTLDIEAADNPRIDVQNDRLILTATRGADCIRITAPLNSVVTSVPVQAQEVAVAAPKPKAKRPQKYKARIQTWGFQPGENSPNSKLKESDVREIKALIKDPSYMETFTSEHAALKDLAKIYKVHFTTIYQIVRGSTWKHVEV